MWADTYENKVMRMKLVASPRIIMAMEISTRAKVNIVYYLNFLEHHLHPMLCCKKPYFL